MTSIFAIWLVCYLSKPNESRTLINTGFVTREQCYTHGLDGIDHQVYDWCPLNETIFVCVKGDVR